MSNKGQLSPDKKTAYIAYLDFSETDVHVQQVDPTTFKAVGSAVTIIGGKEAGGLVAQNDGFALLTNVVVTGTDAPPDSTPVPVIVRYTNGKETWRTFVAGQDVDSADGLSAGVDMDGDRVYSAAAGLYGAYFVVSDYEGWASGHFGDSIQYVNDAGELQTISDASSSWGCSHNTGIAFEASDAAPFASICAEDQGDIWLNTKTRSMSNAGVKISGEHVINGASGEPMGGMSGSYSQFASLPGTSGYAFAWNSRGCIDLTENTWMGDGYTNCKNRTDGRNVATAMFTDKYTKVGPQAIATVGALVGDAQVNWITTGTADRSNVHAEAFNAESILVSWEEIAEPTCPVEAMGCSGQFTGSYFQQVDTDGNGTALGEPIVSQDVYVAGDMVRMPDGRICWPYVSMTWDLSKAVGAGLPTTTAKSMSFACLSLGAGSGNSTAGTGAVSTTVSGSAPTTVSNTSSTAASAMVSTTAPAKATTTGTGDVGAGDDGSDPNEDECGAHEV